MKKIIVILVAIIFSFTSCKQAENNQVEAVDKKEYSIETLRYDRNIVGKRYTSDGYYEISNVLHLPNGNNILFTDFATKTCVFLCNAPACKHDTETCNSYIDGFAEDIFVYEDKLIIMSKTVENEKHSFLIETRNLGGEDSKRIYKAENGLSIDTTYLASQECIFLVVHDIGIKNNNLEGQSYILKINMNTGEQSKIFELEDRNFVIGSSENSIVIKTFSEPDLSQPDFNSSYENVVNRIYCIDSKGKLIDDASKIEWKHFERETFVLKDKLYSFLIGTSKVIEQNIQSGEQKEFNSKIEIFEYGKLNIDNIYDENLIFYFAQTTVKENLEKREIKDYCLNLETAEFKLNNIKFPVDSSTRKVSILAEYGEYFLVNNDFELLKIKLESRREYNRGEIVEEEIEIPIKSFILKSDYFNSIEKYQRIENEYLT